MLIPFYYVAVSIIHSIHIDSEMYCLYSRYLQVKICVSLDFTFVNIAESEDEESLEPEELEVPEDLEEPAQPNEPEGAEQPEQPDKHGEAEEGQHATMEKRDADLPVLEPGMLQTRPGPVTIQKASVIVGKAIAKAMARESSVRETHSGSETPEQQEAPMATPESSEDEEEEIQGRLQDPFCTQNVIKDHHIWFPHQF